MEKVRIFDLRPIDGRKSFYGKAKVVASDTVVWLYSDNTLVCAYIPETLEFKRIWNGYSATTMRHVNAFGGMYYMKPLSKADWLSL